MILPNTAYSSVERQTFKFTLQISDAQSKLQYALLLPTPCR